MAEKKQTENALEQANALQLVVTKNITGVLETNITRLELYIDEKLKSYTPETYLGDADAAKKDRAELNNAQKRLSQSRIQLMKELMKPYADFEARCKLLEKKIGEASGKLDEIVKAKEAEEKRAKEARVNELWLSKNFAVVPLEKVFNPKWLNKTTKESDISAEMDAIIKRIYSELKIIEKYGDDAETLKAHYLICLNISDTMDYGEELAKQREAVAKEKAEREAREHGEQIEKQRAEVREENARKIQDAPIDRLAQAALGIEKPVEEKAVEYVVTIRIKPSEVNEVKSLLTSNGIEYAGFERLDF